MRPIWRTLAASPRRHLLAPLVGSLAVAVILLVPVPASASNWVNDTSGWYEPITNTSAVSGCGNSGSHGNGWNINEISSSTGIGQEFTYSRQLGQPGCNGWTTSKTVYMGIYGQNFTWNLSNGYYPYTITWSVSYNISESIHEDGMGCSSAVASSYFLIKTNLFDQFNLTNVWAVGPTGTINNPSVTCSTTGLSFSDSYSQADVTYSPTGGVYLTDGHAYSIWSEIILKSLATADADLTTVRADIDMQSNSQYGQVVSFVIQN
jgi:hypothetical protein